MTYWDNLNVFQLRELGRWLDWAEHHAMYEFARADDGSTDGYSTRVKWQHELKTLADTQAHVRDLEHKYKLQAA